MLHCVLGRFTGIIEEGRPLFLPCNPPMPGAFVSVHFEGPPGVSLSICEAFVYTDQALPIERCPTFRDQVSQSLGSIHRENQNPIFTEAREHRYLQRQVLHLLRRAAAAVQRGGAVLSGARRQPSGREQPRPAGLLVLGALAQAPRGRQRTGEQQ